MTDESLRCLAWCGRLLILGFLGGGPTNIRSNYPLIKGIDVVGGLNEAAEALQAVIDRRVIGKAVLLS